MDTRDERIKALEEENLQLKARLAALERRLGINSETSSKPPSSDGLGKKKRPPLSSRGSGKPRGGQKGHKGKTLEQVAIPDKVVVHEVSTCRSCAADLSQAEAEKVIKRQVFDVEIRRVVTEHQAEVKRCGCGVCTTGIFPVEAKAPVQIGNTAKAIALYLSEQFIAKDRLSTVMGDLFSLPVSDTRLLAYEADLAKNLGVFHEESYRYLQTAPVKNSDETGIRVGGKTQWMHTLCNEDITYLWHSPQRKCTLSGLSGVLVHDHYQSYLQLTGVTHAFCNAHHLRELNALKTYEKEPWASDMHQLLTIMCHAKNEGSLTLKKITSFSGVYDKLIQRGLDYHASGDPLDGVKKRGRRKRRIGHNLALRLQKYKEGVLLFLRDPVVPFTNNQAERDLRMVKTKQKISGCFRTTTGVQNFAIIRSFIGTVKKQGMNVLEALKMAISKPMRLSDLMPLYKTGLPALIAG